MRTKNFLFMVHRDMVKLIPVISVSIGKSAANKWGIDLYFGWLIWSIIQGHK